MHRRHLIELMQRYTAVKADAAEDDVALALVVDAELFRLEAAVRWLDTADARLAAATPLAAASDAPRRRHAAPGRRRTPGGAVVSAMLELRQVSKIYGEGAPRCTRCATSTSSVAAGELVAVMGPSGSGKSSLLTIAGSLEEPTSGEVRRRRRRRCAGMSRKEKAAAAAPVDRLRVPGLQPARRADRGRERGDAARARRHPGARGARPRRSTRSRSSGSRDRAEHFPDDLSGGERQRVAIARAVVGERRLLLADEPTGALDSVNSEAVMRLLRAITRRGAAGVVVTHDAQLASWADRVVFLRDGRVVDQTGAPAGPESLLAGRSAVVSEREPAPAPGRRAVAALGVAAVPPRVAPAGAGAGPAHGGRRGRRRRQRRSAVNAASHKRRRVRRRRRHDPHRRPRPGRPHAPASPRREQRFGAVEVIGHTSVAVPGFGDAARRARPGPARRLRPPDAGAARRAATRPRTTRSRSPPAPPTLLAADDRRSGRASDAPPAPSSAWSRTRATSTTSSPSSPPTETLGRRLTRRPASAVDQADGRRRGPGGGARPDRVPASIGRGSDHERGRRRRPRRRRRSRWRSSA